MRAHKLALFFVVGVLLSATNFAHAQAGMGNYEDFGAFSGDVSELESETQELFGRYFQMNLSAGSAILMGGLGQAYSPSFSVDARFVFFFDKIWAAEMSAGYSRFSGSYTETNTLLSGLDLPITMNAVPFSVGLRYGFDHERLARGLATMNPYLAFGGEVVFRNEAVSGNGTVPDGTGLPLSPTYDAGAVVKSSGLGVNFGGGIEFDVYRKKLFLGIDLRYHLIYWSNGNDFFGDLDRRGNYVSFMGGATYNY